MTKNRIGFSLILILAITALVSSAPAHAGAIEVVLEPLEKGGSMDGVAALHTRGKLEGFVLRVFGKLPDGTMLGVAVVKKGVVIDVAKLEIMLGSGAVRLYSDRDVSPVFPLAEIDEILVFRGPNVVLRGQVLRTPR